MLNYIWIALIVIGMLVALGTDIGDLSSNTYQNGRELKVTLTFQGNVSIEPNKKYQGSVTISREDFSSAYTGQPGPAGVITQKVEYVAGADGKEGALHIFVDDETPPLWQKIFQAQRNPEYLLGRIRLLPGETVGYVQFDPVKFVKMNQVTNDGIIKYAKIAVELALGLIGIMALWLGIMKIAEQAGLIAKLGSLLKPLTTRLFPDVPPEHPAMGAMIMNISANMLGLANAATPFGLKAMEELNKLNKKVGVATDAMCTFLVINTSSVQFIPATVIAIRAAAGSANPTDILGPVIVATTINTTIGIIVVKLLARMPVFRKQLEA